jgi:hypothetical protein
MENEKIHFSHSGLLGHGYDKETDRSSDEVAEVGDDAYMPTSAMAEEG